MKLRIALFLFLVAGFATPVAGQDGYPRQTDVDILHYTIRITLPLDSQNIEGQTTITAAVSGDSLRALTLDLSRFMTVRRILVNTGEARFTREGDRLLIHVSEIPRAGDRITVDIFYDGAPTDGLIIRENRYGQRTAFADNWPDRARLWFPGIDHPSDKATVDFEVTAPSRFDVVANGQLTETTTLNDGNRRARWRMDVPIPTYCMVIGVAPFSVLHIGEWNHIPVSFYLFPQDRETGLKDFDRALRMLAFYTELIGPYPYSRLGLIQSSTRFSGMENAGAIFFDEKTLSGILRIEGTVAHEIAHQWFGDAITPGDWRHLWLSEGFATYFGHLFFERADGRDRFLDMMANTRNRYLIAYARDPGGIYNPEVADLFKLLNAYNYSKGAWVLHMLRGLMGDTSFFTGIREYYRVYRNGTALTADFQRVMESHAGRSLDRFFRQWIYEKGHPVFQVSYRWDDEKKQALVTLRQTQPGTVFQTPLDLVFKRANLVYRERVEITDRESRFAIPLENRPDSLLVDPDEWTLKEVTVREE